MGYLADHGCTKQYNNTRRYGNEFVGLFVLHSAENVTDLVGEDTGAESVARFICGRSDYGSYHDLVDRDSAINMAPFHDETFHCRYTNPWSYGISVAWTKADLGRMSRAQRNDYYDNFASILLARREQFMKDTGKHVPIGRWLSRNEALAKKAGITTHSRTDPARRSDPFGTGSQYETEFLNYLNDLAKGDAPNKDDLDDGKVSVDGKWGASTTTAIQIVTEAPYIDGEVSRQNEVWEGPNPGLTTGWQWVDRDRAVNGKGSQTISLMQDMLRILGFKPGISDGLVGPKFIKALQRWLTDVDLYDGLIDGKIDKPSKTVKGLQKAINRGVLADAMKKAGLVK